MKSETPITDSLLKWGRSGSFYPVLIPDPESQEALQGVQGQISGQLSSFEVSESLHSTFFYLRPPKLYKKLLEIRPSLNEAQLYVELSTVMATLAVCMHMYPFETEAIGIERFGPNDEMVALKLAEMAIRSDARKMLQRNLSFCGFSSADLDELAEDPDYQWVFGPSNMHISLGGGIGDLDERVLSIPEIIRFSTLGDGSVEAPGTTPDERLSWYLISG